MSEGTTEAGGVTGEQDSGATPTSRSLARRQPSNWRSERKHRKDLGGGFWVHINKSFAHQLTEERELKRARQRHEAELVRIKQEHHLVSHGSPILNAAAIIGKGSNQHTRETKGRRLEEENVLIVDRLCQVKPIVQTARSCAENEAMRQRYLRLHRVVKPIRLPAVDRAAGDRELLWNDDVRVRTAALLPSNSAAERALPGRQLTVPPLELPYRHRPAEQTTTASVPAPAPSSARERDGSRYEGVTLFPRPPFGEALRGLPPGLRSGRREPEAAPSTRDADAEPEPQKAKPEDRPAAEERHSRADPPAAVRVRIVFDGEESDRVVEIPSDAIPNDPQALLEAALSRAEGLDTEVVAKTTLVGAEFTSEDSEAATQLIDEAAMSRVASLSKAGRRVDVTMHVRLPEPKNEKAEEPVVQLVTFFDHAGNVQSEQHLRLSRGLLTREFLHRASRIPDAEDGASDELLVSVWTAATEKCVVNTDEELELWLRHLPTDVTSLCCCVQHVCSPSP